VQFLNGMSGGSIWAFTSSDNQSNAIVPDGAGGCVVTWLDLRTFATTGNDVYAQRLTAAGSVAAGWAVNGVPLCTDPGNQNGPSLVQDGSGGAIGTWLDSRPAPFAQHVSAAGLVTGPANGLALSSTGPTWLLPPQGVSDGAGGAIFVWNDSRDFGTTGVDIYGHHVITAPVFALDPAWPIDGAPVSTALGDQGMAGGGSLVRDGAGGAVAAWEDARDFPTNGVDVYTQSLLASGSLPTDPVATITSPASGSIFPVNTAVTFTGDFTDADPDLHSAQWEFDTLPPVAGTVNEMDHTVTANYTFTTPGVYLVKLTVTDQCGGSSSATQIDGFEAMVVIYDPSAGFVTGGGWFDSPAGAYLPDQFLLGRANFGFVSKYQKGATVPTGNTEFQFRTADFNFSSTSYDWLVVAGARAQYKGEGTINGAGEYGFMLTAIDGNLLGGQPDRFRMRIKDSSNDAVIYDNQMSEPDGSDPTTVLGGGSIVIHKAKGLGGSEKPDVPAAALASAVEYALSGGEPNPFRLGTVIQFGLAERSRVEIDLYDVSGKRMRNLVRGELEAGAHVERLSNQDRAGAPLAAGIYFLRMNASSIPAGTRFSATRKLIVIE
jgi:PKD repeat protein